MLGLSGGEMRLPLQSVLLLFAMAAAAGAACGGPSGSGGATTTTSSSSTSASTNGSSSGTTSTSTSDATTSDSTTTTTTTSYPYWCANSHDTGILAGTLTWPNEVSCVPEDAGAAPDAGTVSACIEAATSLSSHCAACIADDLACSTTCKSACAGDPASRACFQCRQANCSLAFTACSGLTYETGSLSCASIYGDGPQLTSWVTGLWETFFTTAAGYAAYHALDACTCGTCAQVCGTHYCGGSQVAAQTCLNCLQQQCAGATADCQGN